MKAGYHLRLTSVEVCQLFRGFGLDPEASHSEF
jgi:hypothetical protein